LLPEKPKIYKSQDAAAIAWLKEFGRSSVQSRTESSGLIYKVKLKNGKYGYSHTAGYSWNPELPAVKNGDIDEYHTAPGPSTLKRNIKDIPAGAEITAHIHTHGGFDGIADEYFSKHGFGYVVKNYDYDMFTYKTEVLNHRKLDFYLGTPTGNLYRRDAEDDEEGNQAGVQLYLAGGFYHDPEAEKNKKAKKDLISHLMNYKFENFKIPDTKEVDLKPLPEDKQTNVPHKKLNIIR
jgi:hypothetical protein